MSASPGHAYAMPLTNVDKNRPQQILGDSWAWTKYMFHQGEGTDNKMSLQYNSTQYYSSRFFVDYHLEKFNNQPLINPRNTTNPRGSSFI